MKRKPKATTEDSELLHAAITEIVNDYGRGGLSFVAKELNMTTSAMRKRLLRPETAFDGPTLRACILVMELKRQKTEQQQPPAQSSDTQAQPS